MKSKLPRLIRSAIWFIVTMTILLLIVYPTVLGWLARSGKYPMGLVDYLKYIELAQTILMVTLGAIWVFFLGSCFASFLNVVAWRVPRGRSINGSSRCPYCDVKLSFRDNIPIVGWLRNNGRCRSCRLPISARYLIVEIILGVVFLLVCGVQLLSGGINLPLSAPGQVSGFEQVVLNPEWGLIQLTIYHLELICFLFTFSLIRSERLQVPVSLFISALVLALGMPLVWPAMLPVNWNGALGDVGRFSLDQLSTIVIGMASGAVLGGLIHWSAGGHSDQFHSTVHQPVFVPASIAAMTLVGCQLGWQSCISVAMFSLAIGMLARMIAPSTMNSSQTALVIMVATLVHLFTWRWLDQSGFWPGSAASPLVLVIAIIGVFGLAIASRTWAPTNTELAK